ncbi:MAG: hypothetical protein ACFFGZ_13680 [Candidatus Thorarchaeota archaeon]
MDWPFSSDKHLAVPSTPGEPIRLCQCSQDSELLYDPVTREHSYQGACSEMQFCAIIVVAKYSLRIAQKPETAPTS